jgi:hypothetical protein
MYDWGWYGQCMIGADMDNVWFGADMDNAWLGLIWTMYDWGWYENVWMTNVENEWMIEA